MKLILLPFSVCDIFTLAEAVDWVAFKAPAIIDRANIYDAFEHPRSVFPYEAYPFPLGESVSPGSLDNLSFPEYPDCPSPRVLELCNDDPILKHEKEEFLAYKQTCINTHNQYEREKRAWDDTREEAIEPAKAALFLAFKEGRLKAKGELSYVLKKGLDKDAWAKEGEDQWDEFKPPAITEDANSSETSENHLEAFKKLFSDYPGEHTKAEERYKSSIQDIEMRSWRMTGVDWENSHIKSPDGFYMCVSVSSESLFSLFPPPKPAPIQLNTSGGLVILDDGESSPNIITRKSKRGRPPSISWDSFHVEMAKRISNNSLPRKQESCIADIQQWCLQQWGVTPERSTLLEKISPYYRAFKTK